MFKERNQRILVALFKHYGLGPNLLWFLSHGKAGEIISPDDFAMSGLFVDEQYSFIFLQKLARTWAHSFPGNVKLSFSNEFQIRREEEQRTPQREKKQVSTLLGTAYKQQGSGMIQPTYWTNLERWKASDSLTSSHDYCPQVVEHVCSIIKYAVATYTPELS